MNIFKERKEYVDIVEYYEKINFYIIGSNDGEEF